MKEKLFMNLIGVIMFIVPIAYLNGVHHSFSKHDTFDGILSIVVFPIGIYRGLEAWWHEDDKSINEELSNDLRVCIEYLSQVDNSGLKDNEDFLEFKAKISEYQKEQRQFLIDGSKIYIKYIQSVINDVALSMQNYFYSAEYKLVYKDKTIKLEEDIKKYLTEEEVENIKEKFQELTNLIPDNASEQQLSQYKKDYESFIMQIIQKNDSCFKATFYTLFKEEL